VKGVEFFGQSGGGVCERCWIGMPFVIFHFKPEVKPVR